MANQGQIAFPEQYSATQMALVYQQLTGLIKRQETTIITMQSKLKEAESRLNKLESSNG